MTQIIAFAGQKQSGKNTACNFILAIHLAAFGISKKTRINDKGEIEVSDLWGTNIPNHEFFVFKNGLVDNFQVDIRPIIADLHIKEYGFADKLKEILIDVFGLTHEQCYGTDAEKNQPTHLRWEDMPDVDCDNDTSGYMTGREVMQYLGTNIFRKIHQPCWTNYLINRIKQENPEIALISDMRFINEVEAIKNEGGFIVQLLRTQSGKDLHTSETSLNNFKDFDAVIDNRTMNISEQNEVVYNTLKHLNIFPSFN